MPVEFWFYFDFILAANAIKFIKSCCIIDGLLILYLLSVSVCMHACMYVVGLLFKFTAIETHTHIYKHIYTIEMQVYLIIYIYLLCVFVFVIAVEASQIKLIFMYATQKQRLKYFVEINYQNTCNTINKQKVVENLNIRNKNPCNKSEIFI